MTEAERLVAEAEARKAQQKPKKAKSGDANPDMQLALTKVADAQYERGQAMTKAIAQESFMRGINDQISAYLDNDGDIDEEISLVIGKLQKLSAKQLKPASENRSLVASLFADYEIEVSDEG